MNGALHLNTSLSAYLFTIKNCHFTSCKSSYGGAIYFYAVYFYFILF
jgi:hypothetical protein